MNWKSKEVLITGGTGSLGKTLAKILLKEYKPKGIRIFSRDELKQWEMRNEIKQDYAKRHGLKRAISDKEIPISYLIGNVQDRKRMEMASKGVNILIHCAALKQVPACEDNPLEAIKTNVIGAQNVLYAALENKIEKVLAISTDKAVMPINLYGAAKLCAEKLFINGNVYSGGREPRFSCVRYGNVLGSRGSVIPLFKKQFKENGRVTITDPNMTRFWITLNSVASLILKSIEKMNGEEIFIPKMGSSKITTLLEAVIPQPCEIEYTGIRPGEKLHEILITEEESKKIIEYPDHYVIGNEIQKGLTPFEYRSDNNHQQLTYGMIRKMLND